MIKNITTEFKVIFSVTVFVGIWINVFMSNAVAYIASVGASSYYFTSSKDKEGEGEIHLGF